MAAKPASPHQIVPMRHLPVSLGFLALLAGCALPPLPPSATLPPDAVSGGADPMRSAILTSAYVFGSPGASTAPARARAAAMVEYMAADYRWNPRWSEYTPVVGGQLDASRSELRRALAVAPGAVPQQVVSGLFGASRAMASGDAAGARAALVPAVFLSPDETLRQLSTPAALPVTQAATSLAERELHRIDNQSHFNGGGDSGAHP